MELIIYRDAREAGRLRLSEGSFSIGRGLHNTIALDDQSISRRHARLHVSSGQVIIQDLGSINGTLLNGSRIREAEVNEGDALTIGPFTIEVRLADEDVVYHDGLDSTSPGSRPEQVRVNAPVAASAAPARPPLAKGQSSAEPDDEGMHPHDFLGLGEEDWSETVPTTPLPSAAPSPKASALPPKPVPARSRSSVKIDPSALTRRSDGRLSLTPRPKPPPSLTSVDSADFIFESDGANEHDEEDIFPQMPTEATTILRLPNTVDLTGSGPAGASSHTELDHTDSEPEVPSLHVPPGMARQTTFQLGRRTFYIGRAEEADIVLLDSNASRRHACIAWEDGAFVVKDLWSLNGILVNDARVSSTRLRSGDRIRVGDTEMTFVWKAEPPADIPAPAPVAAVTGRTQLPPPPDLRTTPALPARPVVVREELAPVRSTPPEPPAPRAAPPPAPVVSQARADKAETNLLSIGKSASPALPVGTPQPVVSRPGSGPARRGPALLAGSAVAVVTFAVLFLTRSEPEPGTQQSMPAQVAQQVPPPEQAAAFTSTVASTTGSGVRGMPVAEVGPGAAGGGALLPGQPASTASLSSGGQAGIPSRPVLPVGAQPPPSAIDSTGPQGPGSENGRGRAGSPELSAPVTASSPTRADVGLPGRSTAGTDARTSSARPGSTEKAERKTPDPVQVASKPPKGARSGTPEPASLPVSSSGDLERRMANQYQAGQAALRQGKLQEAIRLFQRALQEDPDRSSELYYQIEEEIENTRARLNDQVRPLVAEARSLAEAGQLVEAHQRLQEAIARAPEYQPAASTLKQVQAELDRQGNKLLSAAQAKEQAGSKSEAQGLYRQVLALFPERSHPMHQKAAARLEKLSN